MKMPLEAAEQDFDFAQLRRHACAMLDMQGDHVAITVEESCDLLNLAHEAFHMAAAFA